MIMAMEWINLEASTKKGDAANYPGGERTVKYQVLFPVGHDGPEGKGKLINAALFLENAIQEYSATKVGQILFKQLVVIAQSEPRTMMANGARDETIQSKMRDWKADAEKIRNVKSVQVNAYQDALDRFNAATNMEEMIAARNALQEVVNALKAEKAKSSSSNGVSDIEENELEDVTVEANNGEDEVENEEEVDEGEELADVEASRPFQRRRR
jgi:hypothetical protein